MSSHESIELQRQSSGRLVGQQIQDLVADDAQEMRLTSALNSRHLPVTDKARVLIACSILQVPIWGFAMTYGIFQEYYEDHWSFHGSQSTVGVIGMTYNGVMYLTMPIFFALFARRWARFRRAAAFLGIVISCVGFLVCSFATDVWHLVLAQGILAGVGGALLYTPTTLSLGEHYTNNNRTVAYGLTLSCKNITGTACPFLMQALLNRFGFQKTMWIWTAIVASTCLLAVIFMPMVPLNHISHSPQRPRSIPWDFLRHRTFWIFSIAIILQSSGYGLPQTYLNSYAHEVASLSVNTSTLLITLFNGPGIISSTLLGYLSDNKWHNFSATTTTCLSAIASGLSTFLLWGLAGSAKDSLALLILYSAIFGFFAGGYSSTWGGILKEIEAEAAENNEAIDSGMVYGLLNGARGIGFVSGGLVGVQLLKAGGEISVAALGYGTKYGPLIIYTGLATGLGGWGIVFRGRKLLNRLRMSTCIP